MIDNLLTIKEVSEILRVSVRTLERWDDAGKLPAIKTVGGHRRFKQEDIDTFLGNESDKPEKTIYKHFNGLDSVSKRLNAYIITKDSVQFAFEQETGPKQEVKHLVGVDTGINALASLSDGQQLGVDVKECIERTKRCQWGSKGHGRAQRALKQRIDETAKGLVNQPYELVVVEKLGGLNKLSKVTRRVTGNIRRSLGSWNYRYWLDRVQQQCEWNRISFRTVNPAYTSQKCSSCGHTQKSNRHGENFKCQVCGLAGNADINAALNILGRFLSGTYGSRYKSLCLGETDLAGSACLDVGFV